MHSGHARIHWGVIDRVWGKAPNIGESRHVNPHGTRTLIRFKEYSLVRGPIDPANHTQYSSVEWYWAPVEGAGGNPDLRQCWLYVGCSYSQRCHVVGLYNQVLIMMGSICALPKP